MNGKPTDTSGHAHLLVSETDGLATLESPEAVMEEVAFRETGISSVLQDILRNEEAQDRVEMDDGE
jgi:hypothetical protein